MIQLTRNEVIAARADVEKLRAQFQATGCVLLRNLLEPQLLAYVADAIEEGQWEAHTRKGFDSNCILAPCAAVVFLHFVINRPMFLELVQEITGCGPFTWFGGLVYRMAPNTGHYDSWHTDNTDGRRAALSLNLSPRRYQGGVLQIKARGSDTLLAELANTGFGDAVLFRIAADLLHQVTEVEGVEPKTAFAGWFNATAPSFADRLHSLAPA